MTLPEGLERDSKRLLVSVRLRQYEAQLLAIEKLIAAIRRSMSRISDELQEPE